MRQNLERQLRQLREPLRDRRRWEELRRNLAAYGDPQYVDQVAQRTRSQLAQFQWDALGPQLRSIAESQRAVLASLDDPLQRQRLKRQLVGDPAQWEALRRQVASLGSEQYWTALRRQLAPLRDPAVLEELRRSAETALSRERLEALRQETETLDDLADTLEGLGDPGGDPEDLSWVDRLPTAAATRMFLVVVDYSILLVGFCVALGIVPPWLTPALNGLQKLVKALRDRIQKAEEERGQ